jgi:excisionase family DNA binding protein
MAELFNPDDLISQAEAAELRGVSRASINELVTRGRLRSVVIGGKPYLYRAEVLSFERDKGGRPPKPIPSSAKSATGRTGAKGVGSTGGKKGSKK